MALQNGMALASMRVPYPDTRVETASRNSLAVKGNRINLAEMTGKGPQTAAFGDAPYACCCVIASRNNKIPMNSQTSYACLVANQDVLTHASREIPNPQCCISRTRDCSILIRHFQATHGGRVASQ